MSIIDVELAAFQNYNSMPGSRPFGRPPRPFGRHKDPDDWRTKAGAKQGGCEAMRVNGNCLSLPPIRMADDDRKRKSEQGGPGTAVITKTRPQTKRPNLYRVLLLNDDYTPMEFVVHVLERFFNKDRDTAHRIMMHVHQQGIGECGVFTYEVAETKVTQVMDFARKHQHPLQCIMEKK
jgi:ATP-dependent Clp protease adaptor protein ClpS